MATEKDKIDIQARTEREAKEKAKLEETYKDVTHCEALSGFYWWCEKGIRFFQFWSIILGLGFPLMLADRMPTVAAAVFALGMVILVSLELAKGWVMKRINVIRIVNKDKKEPVPLFHLLTAAAVLFAANIAIGFYSAPFIVDTLIPVQGVESISSIDSIYTAKEKVQRLRFDSLAKKFEAKADSLAIQHSRKDGTIHSAGAKGHAKMVDRAATQSDSLTAVLSFITRERSQMIQAAESRNKETIAEHKSFCKSFSLHTAFAALIIEIFLTVLAFACADFDKKKLEEKNSIATLGNAAAQGQSVLPSTNSQNTQTTTNAAPLPTKKVKGKRVNVFNSPNLSPTMQFQQGTSTTLNLEPKEGDILPPVGRGVHRALIEVNGKLDARTKGQLRTLKSSQGNDKSERSIFIQTLIDKLP